MGQYLSANANVEQIQGGDFIKGNGTGSATIFGSDTFNDEGFPFTREYPLYIFCFPVYMAFL